MFFTHAFVIVNPKF